MKSSAVFVGICILLAGLVLSACPSKQMSGSGSTMAPQRRTGY